jgi:EAL domain-containing protein (putative c-di-GMP-specific phosphodiesterase class I)
MERQVKAMKTEEFYLEYSQEPKSAELALKLAVLQKDALAEKDLETYLKATLLLQETHVFLQSYDEAVAVLRNALKTNVFSDYKVIVSLTDKLIGLLLKTEDFPVLESVLAFRERFIADNPAQVLMQKFYLSVCLEGLKKYGEAIRILENIGDNISNSNLVSKYLKLAMLYLRIKNPGAARTAFEHALLFDKNRKNEMFFLVESDLLAVENDLTGALKKFQEFFLKSKVKNRYLDRYIAINSALGNFDEAWKFYQEYATKMSEVVSKNYRYQFYQAGCQLAETMQKFDEAAEIRQKMMTVHDDPPVILDAFDGIRALLALSAKKNVFAKTRDIILETYRDFSAILTLPGLFFIQPAAGEAMILEFRKGLLLEMKVTESSLSQTVVGNILSESVDYALYTEEELETFPAPLPASALNSSEIVCVMSFRVALDTLRAAFIVAFLDKDTPFDSANKLLFTAKAILETKIASFVRQSGLRAEADAFERLFTTEDRGLARIAEGTLFLRNAKAREILDTEDEMMPYETFQTLFQTENPLYLDRLISKTVWTLPILSFKKHEKQLEIRVLVDEFTVFLALKDVTGESKTAALLKTRAEKTADYGLWNLHRFATDFADLKMQSSLIAVRAIYGDGLGKRYHRSELISLNQTWHGLMAKAVKTHAAGLYLEEDGTVLSILSTIDKRVIDRIFAEVATQAVEAFGPLMPISDFPIFRAGACSIQKNKSMADNLDHLHDALSQANDGAPLVYHDKNLALLQSRAEAAGYQLDQILGTGTVRLAYGQVGNLETRKVETYRVTVAKDFLPFEDADVSRAVESRHVAGRFFLTVFKQMLKDMADFYQGTHAGVAFAITVNDEILLDPRWIDEIVRQPKRLKMPLENLMVIYRPEADKLNLLSLEALKFLKEKGFLTGLEDIVEVLPVSESRWLIGIDGLFIPADLLLKMPSDTVVWLSGHPEMKLVATGVDKEETARNLKAIRVPRVQGSLLPSFLPMAELIRIVQKK